MSQRNDDAAIQLCWIDWLANDTPNFDFQDMVEFCQTKLTARYSIELRNAVGRLGNEHAAEDDQHARNAVVVVQFHLAADRERFLQAFQTACAEHPIKIAIGIQIQQVDALLLDRRYAELYNV